MSPGASTDPLDASKPQSGTHSVGLPGLKEATVEVLPAHPSSSSVIDVAKQHKGGLVVAAIVVLSLVAAATYGVYHFLSRPNPPAPHTKITQISHWNKPMGTACLSPDGRTVAFNSPVPGFPQVYFMLSSGAKQLQLTRVQGNKAIHHYSFHL